MHRSAGKALRTSETQPRTGTPSVAPVRRAMGPDQQFMKGGLIGNRTRQYGSGVDHTTLWRAGERPKVVEKVVFMNCSGLG